MEKPKFNAPTRTSFDRDDGYKDRYTAAEREYESQCDAYVSQLKNEHPDVVVALSEAKDKDEQPLFSGNDINGIFWELSELIENSPGSIQMILSDPQFDKKMSLARSEKLHQLDSGKSEIKVDNFLRTATNKLLNLEETEGKDNVHAFSHVSLGGTTDSTLTNAQKYGVEPLFFVWYTDMHKDGKIPFKAEIEQMKKQINKHNDAIDKPNINLKEARTKIKQIKREIYDEKLSRAQALAKTRKKLANKIDKNLGTNLSDIKMPKSVKKLETHIEVAGTKLDAMYFRQESKYKR